MSDKKNIKKDFDREAFKKAIAHVESSGGKFLENTTSSAAGRYHFLYRYIQDIPLLRGVTKREFINRPELQEQVMDMAIDGTLPGFPSYKEYAKELQGKYRTNLGLHDIAALTHFLGKGGVKKYLSNPDGFVVPGKNASVLQYINKFRKAFGPDSTISDQDIAKNSPAEAGLNVKVQDKTAVAPKVIKEEKFNFKDSGRDYIDYLNNGELYDKAPVEAEGTIKAVENTDEAPTEAQSQTPTQTGSQVGEGTVLAEDPKKILPVTGELAGKPMDEHLGFLNTLAMGGFLNQHGAQDIIPIENGGTHEENPYGGVPMGIGANGKMNTVEEGEVKFGDYVFSNRLSLGGPITQLGTKANTFADGGDLNKEKDKEKDKEELSESDLSTKILRNILPIPNNAAQLVSSLANSDSKFSTKDSSSAANKHLYRSVLNAIKRTGKTQGGTEYEDYSKDISKDLNGLSMKSPNMIAGSFVSPELEAATTFGRVSYKQNPETGEIEIYDSYDFSKTGDKNNVYAKIRKKAGDVSDGKLDSKPKLIGKFNPNEEKDFIGKIGDFMDNVLNPIDNFNIPYSSVKKTSDAVYNSGKNAYDYGKKIINEGLDSLSNMFDKGGDLTGPTDPKKKESKKNSDNPVTDPVFGPVLEDKPLEFIKNEWQTTGYGGLKKVSETFEVPDVREDYMIDNYVTTQKSDKVNFDLAINDKNALEFLNRYNNPWSRQKLAEQAGLSPEDIDNMILKGLNVDKEIGGEVLGSKASYDASKNKINMGPEFEGKTGVETHERVHASLFDAAQGENLMKILGNPFQQETRSFMKKHSPDTVRYLKKPHEAYGNFVEFREKLGLKPGEQIDEKELNKRIKAKGLTNENFIRVFDDSKVVEALNTIAKVDTKPTMDEYRIA